MVNITGQVQRCVDNIGIKSGVVHVFIPHTTAGVFDKRECRP